MRGRKEREGEREDKEDRRRKIRIKTGRIGGRGDKDEETEGNNYEGRKRR